MLGIFYNQVVANSIELVLVQACFVRGQQAFSQFQVKNFKSEPACSFLIRHGLCEPRAIFSKNAQMGSRGRDNQGQRR